MVFTTIGPSGSCVNSNVAFRTRFFFLQEKPFRKDNVNHGRAPSKHITVQFYLTNLSLFKTI